MEGGELNGNFEKISLLDGSIEFLSENPQPSRAAGISTWQNKIYSFGGSIPPPNYSNKLYEFDPESDNWAEIAEIPFAGETKGEIIDGKLYIFGGFNGTVSDRIDIYSASKKTPKQLYINQLNTNFRLNIC